MPDYTMTRLRLLLLLALSLWPNPAGASGVAPIETGRSLVVRVAPEYAHEVARSSGAAELLHQAESLRRDARTRPTDAGPATPVCIGRVPRVAVDPCALCLPVVRHVTAHCERLPYFATAPPSRR